MSNNAITIDGIKWYIEFSHDIDGVIPLCPKHHLRLYHSGYGDDYSSKTLHCADCQTAYNLPRIIADEKQYILNKIESKKFKNMKFLNLDDEAIPIAEARVSSKDDKFFVTAILTESKVGQRLVVYAGEKGKTDKTQIFVEPEIKRLSFDQNNLHPTDVFVKLEAEFDDSSKAELRKQKEK